MVSHVYIHVPFCVRKCGYCSFFSKVLTQSQRDEHHTHLLTETANYAAAFDIKPKTLYLGGGTPSLLTIDQIDGLVNMFNLNDLAECTLEVNPATLDEEKIKFLSQTPVNRISLGVQSFNDKELKILGRAHGVSDTYRCYELLRKHGFHNISFDLMYGLPDQTEFELQKSLTEIKAMKPEHISTYCLSLESNTPMAKNKTKLPKDEMVADFYRLIQEELVGTGYDQYEISSFSRFGWESKHNLSYWTCSEYLGLGASAHGFLDNTRYANHSCLDDYYAAVIDKILCPNGEFQTPEDLEKDFIIQHLRLTSGLSLEEFKEVFGKDFLEVKTDALHKVKDYIDIDNGKVRLKQQYYFVSNEIITYLID